MESRLCLGTAQFGFKYGIANKTGSVKDRELDKIINLAKELSINKFDTAANYGNSELRLGKRLNNQANIITKVPKLNSAGGNVSKALTEYVKNSIQRLGVKKLHGVLLHNTEDLWEIAGVPKALCSLKDNGLTDKIGLSVYTTKQIERAVDIFKPDIVQAPLNVLDQRIETSGWSKRLNDEGVDLYVRSCFLQGLLTMSRNERPKQFEKYVGLRNWDEFIESSGVRAYEAALSFVIKSPFVKYIVVGVDSANQLQEIGKIARSPQDIVDTERFNEREVECIDPRYWYC